MTINTPSPWPKPFHPPSENLGNQLSVFGWEEWSSQPLKDWSHTCWISWPGLSKRSLKSKNYLRKSCDDGNRDKLFHLQRLTMWKFHNALPCIGVGSMKFWNLSHTLCHTFSCGDRETHVHHRKMSLTRAMDTVYQQSVSIGPCLHLAHSSFLWLDHPICTILSLLISTSEKRVSFCHSQLWSWKRGFY